MTGPGKMKIGKETSVLVTILTCRRHRYLERTLEALERNVFSQYRCSARIFVNAEDESTMTVIERFSNRFDLVETSPENLGQAPAMTRLWTNPEADWILHVEDDMVARRGGWLGPCLEFVSSVRDLGQLRLYPFWESHHICRRNLVTGEPIEFEPAIEVSGERFSLMRKPAHFTFTPSLIRSDCAVSLLPLGGGIEASLTEKDTMRRFHEARWRTAQIYDAPFEHIGRWSAFGGFGVGFGLHESTRLGKIYHRCRRFLVKVAKIMLGRR